MSAIQYGWANLPASTHGIEIADDEDSIAYVYGQDAAAKKIAMRIVDVLRGEDELTALRQQVADLRSVLVRLSGIPPRECLWESDYDAIRAILAATQQQEVQP